MLLKVVRNYPETLCFSVEARVWDSSDVPVSPTESVMKSGWSGCNDYADPRERFPLLHLFEFDQLSDRITQVCRPSPRVIAWGVFDPQAGVAKLLTK